MKLNMQKRKKLPTTKKVVIRITGYKDMKHASTFKVQNQH